MNGSRVEFDSLHTQSADKPINTNQSNHEKVEVIRMKAQNIKELGVIDLDRVVATNGQIETFVPITTIDNELDELLEKLHDDFKAKHPEVKETNFNVNVIYSFGGYADTYPEFNLEVIIWDESDENIVEFYEEIKVNLSEDATKEVKKAIWKGLGHLLFDL